MRVSCRGSWEWGWKEHSSVSQLNMTQMIAESKCMRIAVVLQFIIILSLYASYWTLFLLEWEGFRAVRTESFIDTIEFVGSRWFYNVYLYCKTRGNFLSNFVHDLGNTQRWLGFEPTIHATKHFSLICKIRLRSLLKYDKGWLLRP